MYVSPEEKTRVLSVFPSKTSMTLTKTGAPPYSICVPFLIS
ncbi:hypothetical protein CPK_ORF00668 [Chlamydia pneumoniae LPCoLN]|uniref:Uncharacterized protein n=1 Tax=Chlamydia pneumoniae TaxID=83558 RepID=Q9K232_CHLPN|nr:hypothetical protein CP_0619 [Chlamydia pneumoniae AR39]ACZ33137.1 hypothetical protein CPK_ORF00668 [Chlamydia pneumoniae LPCoLN]CRI32649.1 Uncharacterized protein BN1224_Wien1_A_01560 [Chlamydia pneumoniae]CRI35511.1 Uncharacterized protein BN1224_CM1_A_01580 [Chlamydia pneumoniae]CRI36637.1 Uncharacterized protein BN1224_CV14_A_01560 [Chlamydia pneumoniae]